MVLRFGQLYYRRMRCRCLIVLLLLQGLPLSGIAAVPAYVLQLPDAVRTILVAETSTATLHRYSADQGQLKAVEKRRMSIGQNGVAKQRTGDQRTPLGIYFVVEELDTSNLHEKYGPVAFPLDYPNAWDAFMERSGHGIWIHGVTPGAGARPERDTDGCIALPNEHLLSLKPYLTPLQTPVIVTREMHTADAAETSASRDELLAALADWTDSFRRGDWYRYFNLYASDFVYRGMSRPEWLAYRLLSSGSRRIEDFTVEDVLLLADPEENGLYLSRFRQQVTEAGRTVATTKRLYWRKSVSGDFRIVAEDNG